ncbi:anthranilate synthase component II [Halobacillus litoralis]|uniref:anthranilate synthase component II n=1 Tax=Halobacillus litoralis TaxID=45668 RepID=UPI001CFE3D16|nr:aminodeoxychorismate/anthranilate synthase component II [Halobacillus litoralis]
MITIIDNYDSFTYNLVQYFQQMDSEVIVKRNDEWSVQEIQAIDPDLIVLSPGPGRPEESGVSKAVLQSLGKDIPILGICLGHQLIVETFGGLVEKGARPMHGKVSKMTHDGRTLFHGLPNQVNVTRYHSLEAVRQNLPEVLEVSASSGDGVIMGVRHCSLPIEGIQFHPESILTQYGFEMLWNQYEQALQFRSKQKEGVLV